MRLVPAVLFVATLATGCKLEKLPAAGPFSDDFNRDTLGAEWSATGGNWRIADGEVVIDHGYNHPLWLKRPIPDDAVIELDAWSNDDVGDLKVEAWGDGRSYAQTVSYAATSYLFVFGGWHNQISVIARMDEHGSDRRPRTDLRVVKGKKYHWRIARKGGHIDWQVDGKPFLTFDDPSPLHGAEHRYFGFNDWEAELHFDNLKISN
ncbi:MAG: hypothetical protein JWN44_3193 [Myxococcales bacterium]|nr:hypothetical protein [Myxococcales bacterium]